MLKTIIVFLFLLNSFVLSFSMEEQQEQEIVVLTSIKTEGRPFWRGSSWRITDYIEEKYKEAFFETGFNVIFKHDVGIETLNYYLSSAKTYALFYVTHGTGGRDLKEALINSSLPNFYGDDVKELFQRVNSNMKFLAVVACEGGQIINQYQNQGFYKENSDLMISSHENKVYLHSAIDLSLKKLAKLVDENPARFRTRYARMESPHKKNGYRARIKANKRLPLVLDQAVSNKKKELSITNPHPNLSAVMTIKGEFIGVLARGNHLQEFSLPRHIEEESTFTLKIRYTQSNGMGVPQSVVLSLLDEGPFHESNQSLMNYGDGVKFVDFQKSVE